MTKVRILLLINLPVYFRHPFHIDYDYINRLNFDFGRLNVSFNRFILIIVVDQLKHQIITKLHRVCKKYC